jgi:hypothetical protein
MQLFWRFMTGADESGWDQMARGLAFLHLSLLCKALWTQSSHVFHEVRLLAVIFHNSVMKVVLGISVLHLLFLCLIWVVDP